MGSSVAKQAGKVIMLIAHRRQKINQYAEYKRTHKCMDKTKTTILMQSFPFVALGGVGFTNPIEEEVY